MNDNPFSQDQDQAFHDRAFQDQLEQSLRSINAPQGLHERLMQIPADSAREVARGGRFLWRALPVAAVLLLALGFGLLFQPEADPTLTREILAHIYLEDTSLSDSPTLSEHEVEARMIPVLGEHMPASGATEALAVTFAKDCMISKQRGMHLVVKGETGPVNLMMLPGRLVARETTIGDARYTGLVTPASGGTLVVVGNKREPIARYRDLLVRNLRWEY